MISAFLRIGVRPRPARWSIPSKWDGSDRAMPRVRLLQAVGIGLTLLGVVFTGRVMLKNAALSQLSWDARLLASVAVACAAYALLSVLLVLVWATILKTFAPGCIGAREAFALYATTQIRSTSLRTSSTTSVGMSRCAAGASPTWRWSRPCSPRPRSWRAVPA
jgi:hypothetical protein